MKKKLFKKIIFCCLSIAAFLLPNLSFGQPGGYALRTESNNNFGTAYVLTNNTPSTGILSTTIQAISSADQYLIEWDGFANKWSNTNSNKNSELTLNWGGGSFNGPDGILNGDFQNGKRYTVQIRGLSYSNRQGVIMETDNVPQSFHPTASTAVSSPTGVCDGSTVTISVTLSGNKSAQEKVFIRYAINGNFGTAKVVEAIGTGSTWSTATATIPSVDNVAGTTINYYAYSTTVSATNASDHDLITLRYGNNGGSNYSYTVNAVVTYYADNDSDGFGGSPVLSCTGQPVGTVTNNSDSNDALLTYVDNDGDGFGSVTFAPSGVTNNSDSNDALLTYQDNDADGFGSGVVAASGSVLNTDCNDSVAAVNPSATDVCYDGIDNNCDGTIDNGCTPIVSVVSAAQCGQTLAQIDSYIYADLVPGAQQYRFDVKNLTTGVTYPSLDRFLRLFKITQLSSYAFDNEYEVKVSIRINNVWQPFQGAACTVRTPASTTQLTNCPGPILPALNTVIFANAIPFATGYRFTITNAINPLDTQQIIRNLREFRMDMVTGIQYNTTYNVSVEVRNTDGVSFLPMGGICNVTTPSFPSSFIQDPQCDDYTAPSNTTPIYAVSVPAAEGYRFRLVKGAYSQEQDRVLRSFSLSNFTGITPGTYLVRVAVKIGGVWGEFSGKECSIIVTSGARITSDETLSKVNFEAVAYPNPFATNFLINIQASSQEIVTVKVYDMIGRLLEQKQSKATEMENYSIGNNYPSGVYNVVVTQGEIIETLRVIKR